VRVSWKRNMRLQTCKLCGSSAPEPWFRLGHWTVFRCPGCSLAFGVPTTPLPPGTSAPGCSQYRGKTWTGKEYLDSAQEFMDYYDPLLGKLEDWVAPGRLLDVGCGPGFLMMASRRRGWDATGVDPSPFSASYASETFGLEVITATLDAAKLPDASFDAVVMMHSIEHFADPPRAMARVHALLRPAGVVFLETPNLDCDESRAYLERWSAWNLSEHSCVFSPATLTLLLEKAGLRVLEVCAPVRSPDPYMPALWAWAERAATRYVTRGEVSRAVEELLPAGERTRQRSLSLWRDAASDPDVLVTRAEAAVVLAEALGMTRNAEKGGRVGAASETAPFTDIPTGHQASRQVYLLRNAGIVGGRPDGTFAPDEYLAREDLRRLIGRAKESMARGEDGKPRVR